MYQLVRQFCLSILVIVSDLYLFFYGGACIKFLLHTKITHDLGCVLSLTQDHLGNLKVTGKKSALFCLIYIFLMEKHRRVLPYTKIVDNLRVYYDFGPRPF